MQCIDCIIVCPRYNMYNTDPHSTLGCSYLYSRVLTPYIQITRNLAYICTHLYVCNKPVSIQYICMIVGFAI